MFDPEAEFDRNPRPILDYRHGKVLATETPQPSAPPPSLQTMSLGPRLMASLGLGCGNALAFHIDKVQGVLDKTYSLLVFSPGREFLRLSFQTESSHEPESLLRQVR